MTFGITPVDTNTGDLPVAPAGDPGFTVTSTGGGVLPTDITDFPGFLQWMQDGEPLGDDQVLVVNFVSPLVATRGVGEHENVITVRLAVVSKTVDDMLVNVPSLIEGTLIVAPSTFFTSILYPLLVQDGMQVSVAALEHGSLIKFGVDPMQIAVPALESGTLVVTIAFITYDARPHPDTMQVFVPALESGTLQTIVIIYDARPHPDTMQVFVPALQSGTLVRIVINYTNGLAHPDTMQVFVPSLQSGTLV
jgi:hypothetical protein